MRQLGFLLVILSFACSQMPKNESETKASGRRIGSLKGLQALEDSLSERLFLPEAPSLSLRLYLDREDEPTGLAALLGAFTEAAGFSVQENAVPNPVNTLLWEIVSSKVSADIAAEACSSSNKTLKKEFYTLANSLCQTPDQDTMKALWLSVARYDAPESEMKQWIEEESAADGILQTAKGPERLAQLLQSILMNPYFMLEH